VGRFSLGYILVLDVGTTNIKAVAFSREGELLEKREERTKPIYPNPGWAEQDPNEIMDTVYGLLDELVDVLGAPDGIALTNQRSTTTVWDEESGEPLHNMITWQDTRTEELAEEYSSNTKIKIGRGVGKLTRALSKVFPSLKKTKRGAYISTLADFDFETTHSSMHLKWLMNNDEELEEAVISGDALFGTIDTWVGWNLTGEHVTDYTNASATGLFDPVYLKWSDNLSDILDIPKNILPELIPNDRTIGTIDRYDVPLITTIADQQASLYLSGVEKGTLNITNGTGSFLDLNVGKTALPGTKGIYPMVAIKTGDNVLYLLEGSVNSVGTAVDWLKDIGMMEDYSDISKAFEESGDDCNLAFLPSLSGLSSPYMKPGLKGTVFELTTDTTRSDLIKALILGLAKRCSEVTNALENVSGISAKNIISDGGVSNSDDFLQALADFAGKEVSRPEMLDGSPYGSFLLAKNVLEEKDPIEEWDSVEIDKSFQPNEQVRMNFEESWKKRVEPYCCEMK